MGRKKIIYEVREGDEIVLAGYVDDVAAFFGWSNKQVQSAERDHRLISRKYHITAQRPNDVKPYPHAHKYILWKDDEIQGVYYAREIAELLGINSNRMSNAAARGEVLAGSYTVLDFTKFAEEWEKARKRLKG